MATVRIGVCSWADEGMVKHWYPRGVSSAADRLRYYADHFDVVEVDSPFYALPSPETAQKWAERTPPDFTFHVKASGEMTGHREAERDQAFREFREALAPLERSGKMRGVLLQYHPRVKKSRQALDELVAARDLLDPLVPLVEFRHRSWMEPDEQADTLALPRAARARIRLGRRAADSRLQRHPLRRRGHASRRLRPLPRAKLEDVEHP